MSIAYTLTVTSPLTEGPRVLVAQKKMNGDNVWHRDFHQGAVDGVFGEETGRSCKRAKYWLGYATDDIAATYGGALDDFLRGAQPLAPVMKRRRELRLEEAKKTPVRVAALNLARTKQGVKESPAGSNRVEFSEWYGIVGP